MKVYGKLASTKCFRPKYESSPPKSAPAANINESGSEFASSVGASAGDRHTTPRPRCSLSSMLQNPSGAPAGERGQGKLCFCSHLCTTTPSACMSFFCDSSVRCRARSQSILRLCAAMRSARCFASSSAVSGGSTEGKLACNRWVCISTHALTRVKRIARSFASTPRHTGATPHPAKATDLPALALRVLHRLCHRVESDQLGQGAVLQKSANGILYTVGGRVMRHRGSGE